MRNVLLHASILVAGIAHGQWSTPDANTPVRAANALEAVTPLSAPGPDNSTYISWFENGSGGYVLKMQRLDVHGVALWAPEGLVVSDEPQNSALFRYDLKSDHAGNAIVAFQDERSGQLDIVAYKVAPDGGMLWGDGVPLLTTDGTGLAPAIGVLPDDRVVIAWSASPSDHIGFCILPATGVPAPTTGMEMGATGRWGRPRIVPCSNNEFWLQYVVQTGGFLAPGTLYAARLTPTGTLVYGPVALSSNQVATFYFPDPITDGHDGLYLAFNTGNAANANLTDVYVQRLRSDATLWSTTGTAVETGSSTQRYTQTATPALVSDDDGLMMAYSRTNIDQTLGGVAVQRFDTAGTRQLGNNAVEVAAMSDGLPSTFANAPIPGGIVMAASAGGFGQQLLMAVPLQLDGGATSVGSIVVCSTASGKDDATLVPFREGQAVAVWQDDRPASGIYAQPIRLEGSTAGIAEHADEGPARLVTTPLQELVFPDGTTGPITLEGYAVDGRLTVRRQLARQLPGARVPMEATAAGLQVLVLTTGTQRQVVRWCAP